MPQLSTKGRNCVLQLNADGKSQKEKAAELVASVVLIPEVKLKMYMMMEVHKINLKNGRRKLIYLINNKGGLRERMGVEKWKIR